MNLEFCDFEGDFREVKDNRSLLRRASAFITRAKTISIHGKTCQVCGFNLEEFYGKHGANFIEVHHLKPICNIKEGEIINPSNDMAVLWSNCHRIIHRNRNKILSLDELSDIIKIKK